MARTWSRLVGPAQIATGPTTILTAGAGTKVIVRHIRVYNPGAQVLLTLSIGADAAATRIYDEYPVDQDVPLNDFGIYILTAAEIIQAAASVNNQLVIIINGEVVSL